MSEKKRSPKKDTILHSIQVGDVIAIISSQQSNSGFVYRPFKLLRCFVTSTGKQSRATTFFAKNARDCAQAALAACDWINMQEQADIRALNQSDTQQQGDQKADGE